jgi:hypothetical protein
MNGAVSRTWAVHEAPELHSRPTQCTSVARTLSCAEPRAVPAPSPHVRSLIQKSKWNASHEMGRKRDAVRVPADYVMSASATRPV